MGSVVTLIYVGSEAFSVTAEILARPIMQGSFGYGPSQHDDADLRCGGADCDCAGHVVCAQKHQASLLRLAEQSNRFKTTLDRTMDSVFMFDPETLNSSMSTKAMQQVGTALMR